MPQRSAGILLYRRGPRGIEVLLVHPGGPFWAKKDAGAWSIPKGLTEPDEDPIAVARREFEEETGARLDGDLVPLGAFAQSRAKVIEVWAAEGAFDPAKLTSNTFSMEWPPRSGRMQTFPEVDRAEWFTLEAAAEKILKGQLPVLDALVERIGRAGKTRRGAVPVSAPAATKAQTPSSGPQTSATYNLFRQAILEQKQVTCMYDGHYREVCPIIIGHTDGQEKVLSFQVGGETSSGKVPRGGQWKCLFLSKVRDARLQDGPWREGTSHKSPQGCVSDVDVDFNIHVSGARPDTKRSVKPASRRSGGKDAT